jgi:hypothetical protein
MGNGALPNGPSYRAHPRLYRQDLVKKNTNSWHRVGRTFTDSSWQFGLFHTEQYSYDGESIMEYATGNGMVGERTADRMEH